ncbi:hypothetical protein [Helicobacter saguini]|uniref:hypothetical protein n=1 Tax=Helicobacter saguini TaxID=1548018 RepID=UPI000A514296|nr:hypothetical protein [Helicobacter saguini]
MMYRFSLSRLFNRLASLFVFDRQKRHELRAKYDDNIRGGGKTYSLWGFYQ